MIKYNMNDYVLLKLTEEGRKIYAKQVEQRFAIAAAEVEKAGWIRLQLWEVMNIFGANCFNGSSTPFETEIMLEYQLNTEEEFDSWWKKWIAQWTDDMSKMRWFAKLGWDARVKGKVT